MKRRDFIKIIGSSVLAFITGFGSSFFVFFKKSKNKKYNSYARQKIYIKNVCAACGGCIAVCPTQAIRLEYPVWKIEPSLCILCKNCIKVCPVNALSHV